MRTLLPLLGLVVTLVGGMAIWQVMHPAPRLLSVAGRYPLAVSYLISTPTGFLSQEVTDMERHFILRDWRTGTPRWRITVPLSVASSARKGLGDDRGIGFSLSPDGHYLAVAITDGVRVRLRQWRDGTPCGTWATPELRLMLPSFGLRMLDDGRVFCWTYQDKTATLYAIRGNRCLAQGILAYPIPFARQHVKLAPDGRVLAVVDQRTVTLYAMTVSGSSITCDPAMPARSNTFALSLFPGGIVLEHETRLDCTIGRAEMSTWNECRECLGTESAACGAYTIQQQPNGQARIYAPCTRQAWPLRNVGEVDGTDAGVSPNGRFATVYLSMPSLPVEDSTLPAPVRVVRQWLRRLRTPADENLLALYDRRGRLRARRPLNILWEWEEQRAHFYQSCPSPDGHTVAVVIGSTGTFGDIAQECLLLR